MKGNLLNILLLYNNCAYLGFLYDLGLKSTEIFTADDVADGALFFDSFFFAGTD